MLENVALGIDDDAAVEQALAIANADEFVAAMPEGSATVVGERGVTLSGGQRQRIALARGLFRGGDVLVLDDVLSAVDHATEAELVETLATLGRGPSAPTVLIASHRLSALRHADLVLVLDRGRLVDHGTHSELIRTKGLYRKLCKEQFGQVRLEDLTRRAV